MLKTTNYLLNKPELSDLALMPKISDNMDIIDAELFARALKTDLDTYYKNGAVVMNTNAFGGRTLFISNINNALFNANKRWTVTGIIYNGDGSVYNASVDVTQLFNGDYDAGVAIPMGKYLVVLIDFGGNFPSYPYGSLFISHYYTQWSASASMRVYCNYAPHGLGWHTYNFSDFVRAGANLIVTAGEPVYAISQMEFTIHAPADVNSSITQIDYRLDRPSSNNEMPIVDKFRPNNLYYDLNMTGNKLLGVGTPTLATDATNKSYVDESHNYTTLKSGKDPNFIYTTYQRKRYDGTLLMQSVLSGGTSPLYTTRTETWYASNGSTVVSTRAYTITYDTDGIVVSEV